jgi:hexosaminidase
MSLSIVPLPESVTLTAEVFELSTDTAICPAPGLETTARLLAERLRTATGLPFPLATEPDSGQITLTLDGALPASGYQLLVTGAGVRLSGGDGAGVFHATQTLLQLCPPAVFRRTVVPGVSWELPGVEISDQPRFGWRGMLLDISRHFFGRDSILRLLDALALHRFNVLHLHLTDDQGWRVEITRYPRLTDIGSWRARSAMQDTAELPPGQIPQYDYAPHDGYLSRDDIREIVAYAAERFITIVPEIDLPGHSQAAIAAYPQLGNIDRPLDVWTDWGVNPHVLNVEDATLDFFRQVLEEVLDLFPSTFIHIGGDEVPKDEWRRSATAQARMRDLGLRDEDQLQSWVVGQFAEFLHSRGRRLVGWDEILEGGLPAGTTVMSWRGVEGGIAAAEAGHDVIMAPESDTYLYRRQSEDLGSEPLGAEPPLPLRAVYAYEPLPESLSEAARHHVLGAQCQMWTEFVTSERQLHQLAFPRVSAFSEVVWCRTREPFDGFLDRLGEHLERLHALGIDAYRPRSLG